MFGVERELGEILGVDRIPGCGDRGVAGVVDDHAERGPLASGDHDRVDLQGRLGLRRDRQRHLAEGEVAGVIVGHDVDGEHPVRGGVVGGERQVHRDVGGLAREERQPLGADLHP